MDKIEKIKKEIKLKLSQYKKKYEELVRYEVWITAKEIEQRIKELKDVLFIFDNIKDDPVSDDMEDAAYKYADTEAAKLVDPSEFNDYFLHHSFTGEEIYNAFVEGSKWQKAKDQETIELAEDHAMLAGMEKMKEQMMKDAVDGYVIEDIEEGNGDFLLSADYLPSSMGLKDQQKVKVIILKDE